MRECEDRVAKRGGVPAMSKLRDMMCACKDASCAKGVDGEVKTRMSTGFAHYQPSADKQTADGMTRAIAGSDAATTSTQP